MAAFAFLLVASAVWQKGRYTFGVAEETAARSGEGRGPGDGGPSPPRRAQAIVADECGLSQEKLQDRLDVQASGFFIWESHATMRDCASGEGPCLAKTQTGYIVIYIFGMGYMFIALAIICDEFFVPSLECFTEEFDISADVAGATFMAAGGSMPELFTSFVSTMRGKTGVGFATIVGSAVFNVLFVIAVCAVASKEVLVLTWWPLARDSIFYLLSLFLVLIFFGSITPGWIDAWEAILLFLWYIVYCTFMKFNGPIQKKVKGWLGQKVAPADGKTGGPEEAEDSNDDRRASLGLRNPSAFRQGIVQLLTQNRDVADTVGIAAVTQLRGSLKEFFDKLDQDQDGFLNETEVEATLVALGIKAQKGDLSSAVQGIARNRSGLISFEHFQKWYIASEERVTIEVRRVWDRLTADTKGTMNKDGIAIVLKKLGHHPSNEEITKTLQEILDITPESTAAPADPQSEEVADVTFEQFEAWYNKSMFWTHHHKVHQTEEEVEEEGFAVNFPEKGASRWNWAWFILTYPLCALLYVSMPDVRNGRIASSIRKDLAGCWKVAAFEFVLSLVWIAIFATCLYEWTVICSNTVGVLPEIAGLTLLAAGTSVPDLLSSYVVAKQGEGDMAVSSSLGSNLFDVTVGLPIPWLCYCATFGTSVEVSTDSLGISIALLIVMLAAVIVTVMICKWRMTKTMGWIMLFLYFLFLLQHMLRSFPRGDPLINI
jgi:K+-dependent Na+/Ca+ exchanger-like protein